MSNYSSKTTGFSLVEVLVSLLILSIGLLGLAGLQGVALKTADSANLRATAALLSHEILEQMRANRAAAINGDYTLVLADEDNPAPEKPEPDCNEATCDATEIAEHDVYSWRDNIVNGNATSNKFPSGNAAISVDSDGIATITIQWNDSRANVTEADDPTVSFTISAML
jgi:type IV pilus assembly protein PilV